MDYWWSRGEEVAALRTRKGMGEASQRRKSKRALLKDNPFCIFCGGTACNTHRTLPAAHDV
jgi:hypothetical protein